MQAAALLPKVAQPEAPVTVSQPAAPIGPWQPGIVTPIPVKLLSDGAGPMIQSDVNSVQCRLPAPEGAYMHQPRRRLSYGLGSVTDNQKYDLGAVASTHPMWSVPGGSNANGANGRLDSSTTQIGGAAPPAWSNEGQGDTVVGYY